MKIEAAPLPLPLWEGSDRIERCDPGEGSIREFGARGETPHPKPALRSGFDLSHKGRGNLNVTLITKGDTL
jgi:hypothetical protein